MPECPQTRPYDPILVVPLQSVQKIDPLWSSCSLDIRNAFDPPYKLHQATMAAEPTPSDMISSIPATPASIGKLDRPVQTSASHVYPSTASDPVFSRTALNDPSDKKSTSTKDDATLETISDGKPASINPAQTSSSRSGPSSLSTDPGSEVGARLASYIAKGFGISSSPAKYHTDSDTRSKADGAMSPIAIPDGGRDFSYSEQGSLWKVSGPMASVLNNPSLNKNPFHANSHSDEFTATPLSRDPEPNAAASSDAGIKSTATSPVAPSSNGIAITSGGRVINTVSAKIGVTLSQSGVAVLVEGQPVSVAKKGIVVGSRTIEFGDFLGMQNVAPFSVSGITYLAVETEMADGIGAIVKPIDQDNAPLQQDGQASSVHDGSRTGVSGADASQTIAVFTVAGTSLTAFRTSASGHAEEVAIHLGSSSMALFPGGPAATIAGKLISVGPSGIVVGTTTATFMTATAFVPIASPSTTAELSGIFRVSGTVYTAFETSVPGRGKVIVIPLSGSADLLWPGGPPATIGSEIVSAAGTGLIVDGSKVIFGTSTTKTPSATGVTSDGWAGMNGEATGSRPVSGAEKMSGKFSGSLLGGLCGYLVMELLLWWF
ncbi:MAG: hypothetical protein M1821_003360 [Bathelium mastoideum]|nr:MAG: hypothetical protein M1821_003360 [Bathelium mastoideum]